MADSSATYGDLAAQWARAEALRAEEGSPPGAVGGRQQGGGKKATAANKQQEVRFKAAHGILVAFLTWVFVIHVLGIYFFTKGFLLTRLVLDDISECSVSPVGGDSGLAAGSPKEGCWHPKTFDKAIVIIVDALRYDFTVPQEGSEHYYHNSFPFFYETASKQPNNAFLLPFIADPPTTTLQRLKGLTTGTLPTFVDAGSNFAGTAIEEDNLVAQLRTAGKNLVHIGDDTWHSLFPGYFDPELTRAYDSFNVWDLHTVDNGVIEHLEPLMQPGNASRWDIIFGHFLGVDHAGHRYGPDHPAMAAKLQQMDEFFRKIINNLDDSTLMVVMGDHGMDVKGDHGGESDDEVEAALWMYSKQPVFGRSSRARALPPRTAKQRPVGQIDLVPTLSLLLGMPIPFNNLGAPIEEAFVGKDGQDWKNLALVNHLTAAQIKRYQREYATIRGLDPKVMAQPLTSWDRAENALDMAKQSAGSIMWREAYAGFSAYQRETLSVCKGLWARFDLVSMSQGTGILVAAVSLLIVYARGMAGDISDLNPVLLVRAVAGSLVGAAGGGLITFVKPDITTSLDAVLFGVGAGGLAAVAVTLLNLWPRLLSPLPTSLWGWLSLIIVISPSIGFASNSYTVWEDDILVFFLSSFGVLAVVSSLRQPDRVDRYLGAYQSIVFLVLTRLSSLSRLCREEQMPFCRSTYYASATSSTSAPWQLLIPVIVAVTLSSIIKSHYRTTRSYEGSAVFWLGFALPSGLLMSALFWILDAADDGDWIASSQKGRLKTFRMTIAQLVLAIALAAGSTTYAWAKPCVNIQMTPAASTSETSNGSAASSAPQASQNPRSTLTILGYANTYGTHYFLLMTNVLLSLAIVTKPMGHLSLGTLTWQILALLDLLDSNHLLPNGGNNRDNSSSGSSAIGPVILALLGSHHFFKTGHQATLASIQWDSAFVPLRTIMYPWSPLLVMGNTFAGPILTALAIPLLVFWKRSDPKANKTIDTTGRGNGLLGEVARVAATYLLCFATTSLATTMWAAWLRRHLMLYRVFMPRFMLGALTLVVVDLVVVLVAVGVGVRISVKSVGDVFGWG
ncbi:MAG: mRNA binding protein puf3 [Chaenotheca gracillima]|nr:MAG: mRNA binding protein puf3 [Chaenotheca gracillima]